MMALMKGHFGTKFGTYVTIDPEVMRKKLKKAGCKACLFPEHTIPSDYLILTRVGVIFLVGLAGVLWLMCT
jgi:hypothetical protein